MSVDGPSRDARRAFENAQRVDENAAMNNRKALGRIKRGGIDPQTGGYQAPAGMGGQKKPLTKEGPIATTGQPTRPGRGFPSKPTRLPRGEYVREIVQQKMRKIQDTPRQQLASQPIDRNFSA